VCQVCSCVAWYRWCQWVGCGVYHLRDASLLFSPTPFYHLCSLTPISPSLPLRLFWEGCSRSTDERGIPIHRLAVYQKQPGCSCSSTSSGSFRGKFSTFCPLAPGTMDTGYSTRSSF
ncbi:hypothetical protein HOY82DRAFT_488393, partial [Tuber indicum]